MYPGKKITLGVKVLIVPALSLRQSQEFESLTNEMLHPAEDQNPWALQTKALPMYLSAIQRNYPEIEEDWLLDNIDLNVCHDLFRACMGNTPKDELVTSLGEELQPTA